MDSAPLWTTLTPLKPGREPGWFWLSYIDATSHLPPGAYTRLLNGGFLRRGVDSDSRAYEVYGNILDPDVLADLLRQAGAVDLLERSEADDTDLLGRAGGMALDNIVFDRFGARRNPHETDADLRDRIRKRVLKR